MSSSTTLQPVQVDYSYRILHNVKTGCFTSTLPPVAAVNGTSSSSPRPFGTVIVRSDPLRDALADHLDVRAKHWPRSLHVNWNTDPVVFFGQDFVSNNGATYSHWLLKNIATANQIQVSTHALGWSDRVHDSVTDEQRANWDEFLYAEVRKPIDQVFTQADVEIYGVELLEASLQYLKMLTHQTREAQESRSRAQTEVQQPAEVEVETAPQVALPLQQVSTLPTIQEPEQKTIDSQVAIVDVPDSPPELARPASREPRRISSDQMSGPHSRREGGKSVQQPPAYSSRTMPARRGPTTMPLQPTGRPHLQDIFPPNPTNSGAFHYQAGVSQQYENRIPIAHASYNQMDRPSRLGPHQSSGSYRGRNHLQPLPPHLSHAVDPLFGGTSQFMSPTNMPPHEMIQHPVLDPRLFPGPIPQYMTVFNSGIPPEYVIPQQGRSDLRVPGTGRSEPFANQMQEQFGNFPQQSPAMSQRSPAFSQQSLAFSQQQPPFPHQSQSGFASGRGGFGKGRGRGSFSGPTVPPGRKGSFNLKGTYNGPPGRHGSNNQPINLPIRPEPKPATQNKEIIHPAVGDKGKHPVCETEQFPEYTESGYEVHDQLRDSEKCFPKFIGPDVEEMTQLWVGNIEPSTKSEEFQAFIQTHVPVLNIRPILPDSVDANTWTFVNFHSTTDAREALRYFDKLPFKNIALDVQVPERFRSDVQGVKKYQDRKYSGPRQEHQNSVSSSRRNSVGHRNSFRKERTSSNLGEGRPRRNSVFSPQDARSDLPDLQESLSPPAEQSADTSNSERKSSPKKKGYKKNNKAEGINNGSAAGPTSRRQSKVSKNVNTVNTSFSQTKPTSSDVGSTTSRSAADPTPPDSDSRSEPTLSLQHTSQGRPVFVLDLEEPVIEPSSNEKGTSESQNEESTAPSQSGSSEGDESKAVSNTGKASKKKKAARANTGESRIPQTMAPPEPVVAENVDKVNAAPVECGTEDVAPPVETKQKTAVLDDLAKETDELKDQSGDVDQPEVHSAIEGPVESNAEEISPQGDSMGPLPEITIENSTGPSPSDKSTLPVASATEEKKPESLEDALASPRKAKAVETGSIHPFARKKQQQDQAAKADKKKQKKQSQAGKKGTKTAADIAAKPSQNQEKIRAGSFSSTDTRPDLTRAASPASNAPSAISGNGRGHEAKLSVASSSVASQPEFVPSDEAREKLNPSLDHSGAADPLSQAGLSKQPSPRKSSRPANIVIALPLSFNKRSSSSAIPGNGSSAETKPTTGSPEANAASDTSSPMATPHTARTHQPSAQSPMPILMSSSPLADTTAQPTVGLGISAPEQTLEADVVATLTPEQAQPGAELDAITSDSTKPKKPKKKTNKKKKGKAGEGTEDATASTAAPGGSGGDDGKALPERCQDNDAELGKSYDPGSTSNFADEQDATFRKAASVLKENSPMKLVPSTYAQAAAPNSKGLSARSPNLPASRPA